MHRNCDYRKPSHSHCHPTCHHLFSGGRFHLTAGKLAAPLAVKAAAEKVQWAKRGKLLELSEVAPIRVIASTQDCCMVCKKDFRGMLGILNARPHHCRACGAVVCDACSRERARIPSLDERALFKCCIICAKELKGGRKYGARRRSIL